MLERQVYVDEPKQMRALRRKWRGPQRFCAVTARYFHNLRLPIDLR